MQIDMFWPCTGNGMVIVAVGVVVRVNIWSDEGGDLEHLVLVVHPLA